MQKSLLLLSLLSHPLLSVDAQLQKRPVNQQVNKWFENYSCNELNEKELASIEEELEKIIHEYKGDLNQLESLLAEYCHTTNQKHLHTECFSAVVKACENAIFAKYNKKSSFKQTLLQYSARVHDELHARQKHSAKVRG